MSWRPPPEESFFSVRPLIVFFSKVFLHCPPLHYGPQTLAGTSEFHFFEIFALRITARLGPVTFLEFVRFVLFFFYTSCGLSFS